MREIKFRAWRPGKKFMSPCLTILEWIGLGTYHGKFENSDKVLWMQYTGLKDKNGVEIYEGDFLTGGVGGHVKPVLVEWGKESRWTGMADGYKVHHVGYNLEEYYFILSECEVIGNIHENPELLS